jgi:hypothetical protein
VTKAISVHVGINAVDAGVFNADTLRGCENDARAMFELAGSFNADFVRRELFLGAEATFKRVDEAIRAAAQELAAGDVFFFTFAGHGSQRPEGPGGDETADRRDEEIVLYDRIMIDDYIRRALWSRFGPGVRLLAVADCCHSGTGVFAVPGDPAEPEFPPAAGPAGAAHAAGAPPDEDPAVVEVSAPVRRSITRAERSAHLNSVPPGVYEAMRNSIPTGAEAELKADLLTLAACDDDEEIGEDVLDGRPHGVFTLALLEVLKASPANYDVLMEGVVEEYRKKGLPETPQSRPKEGTPAFRTLRPFIF